MGKHIHFRPRLLLQAMFLAAAGGLLLACGGGGGGGAGGSVPAPTPITVAGIVTTTTSGGTVPVSGAVVTLGPATDTTNSTGNFTVTVDPATVNTTTTVVVTVVKDGYRSCTGTVDVTAGTVAGCDQLSPAADDELHPKGTEAVLVRLGDGEVTGGSTNSKLQLITPFGLSKTLTLGWPASNFTLANYSTFTLHARIRGLQASSCANRFSVLQGTSAATAAPVQVFEGAPVNTLADSDVNGEFSTYALQVPAVAFSASGGNLYVKLESGLCLSAPPGDPSDDFEFVGLFGKFT